MVPLIADNLGFVVFALYEAYAASHPIVRRAPTTLHPLHNASGVILYEIPIVLRRTLLIAVVDWLPVYFQGSKGASPITSSVDILGLPLVGTPASVIAGISVQKCNIYRPQMWFGWCRYLLGI